MIILKKFGGWLLIAFVLGIGITAIAHPAAISQLAGIAVAQTSTKWNSLKDLAVGDGQQNGVGLFSPCLWNGTSCDRQRGTIAGGALVSQAASGTAFFAVKRDNITTSSVNLAYGFTSKKIGISASPTNTDEICVSWIGGTAVCPAANTSGNDRLTPGQTMILDDYAQTSISVIAASGTQTVFIDAWN